MTEPPTPEEFCDLLEIHKADVIQAKEFILGDDRKDPQTLQVVYDWVRSCGFDAEAQLDLRGEEEGRAIEKVARAQSLFLATQRPGTTTRRFPSSCCRQSRTFEPFGTSEPLPRKPRKPKARHNSVSAGKREQ